MKLSRGRPWRTVLVALAGGACAVLSLAACSSSSSSNSSAGGDRALSVWTDATRQPEVKTYLAAHPNIKATVTVVDGDSLASKLSLLQRSPDKLPDVVFTPNSDSVKFAVKYGYPADIDSKIDSATKSGFGATLSACSADGKTYCLPMDVSTQMLFYNKPLMSQFGYTVPTTWSDYAALSAKVATEHPGYVTGSCGDGFCPNIFYRGSDCQGFKAKSSTDVTVTLATDPNCTRVTSMLTPLVADKSVATLSPFDPDMATLGKDQKVLMMPGFVWYGAALFHDTFKNADGLIAVAPLPTWPDGKKGTGAAVGGQWMVGSKSKNQDAGYAMIKSLTTESSLLDSQVTFPAYEPAATSWTAKQAATNFYATDPTSVIAQARQDVTGDLSTPPGAEILTSFASAVAPAIKGGALLSSEIDPWVAAVDQVMTDAGLTVSK